MKIVKFISKNIIVLHLFQLKKIKIESYLRNKL